MHNSPPTEQRSSSLVTQDENSTLDQMTSMLARQKKKISLGKDLASACPSGLRRSKQVDAGSSVS